ncbi:MAG TPA: alpha/beta hydrolase [Acidimicrobiia bacterium]|nr:alpha/beta hydrolase [Acidimicrobiia bacterium]
MPTYTTDDRVEIYYETMGRGERIVLTHGSWTDSGTWVAIREPLTERFEVVVWDRRGHSRSQDGTSPGTHRRDAADLAGLIEHLGHAPAHVVGNSAGGAIVLALVATRPELVITAAVHEPGFSWLLDDTGDEALEQAALDERRALETVRELLEAGSYRSAAESFVDLAIGPGGWNQLPEETQNVLVSNASTFLDEIDEAYEKDSVDWSGIRAADVPLLATFGTESSPTLQESTRALARLLRSVQIEAIEGTGHIPHRTHPERYLMALERFVDRSCAPAG